MLFALAGAAIALWFIGAEEPAAMRYPPRVILSMEHVPEYRAALAHRDAGLEGTVVIATKVAVQRH
jgi:hypothetical protein